ncbi:unnamed protein product [Schistosoma margrebowiei]|nr:unnamed protein product [Schistosoma margrebowiei]
MYRNSYMPVFLLLNKSLKDMLLRNDLILLHKKQTNYNNNQKMYVFH